MDMPGIFPGEFEANAESAKRPGPCPINDPGEVSDESYPHRTTGGPERTPVARALPPGPPDPGIVRATGARADRAVGKGARGMMAWAGRRLWLAVRTVIRAVRMAHHEQVYAVGMHLAYQRGGAADRRRSAALGPVAGRLPARRQPPAGPGPEPNGPVTRAGGRGPRSRPRHRQRILQEHPGPPDRHQPRREPSVICPPAQVRQRPVLAIGEEHPGTPPPACIWPGGSAHHQTGVEEDVARWHAGLAFQVLDDCLDGKAGHLLGVLGDGGEVDVGESGQPRVVRSR